MSAAGEDLGAIDPLRTIATPAPAIPTPDVAQMLRKGWDIEGQLTELVSERDQNMLVTTDDGPCFVCKIANPAEPRIVTEFQVEALAHLQARACPISTPQVVSTRDNRLTAIFEFADAAYLVRVVTFVPGLPLSEVKVSVPLARTMGAGLARLDGALADFEHAGENQPLLWDMQRAAELRPLLSAVAAHALRNSLDQCLDAFETLALPVMQDLRHQVIHGDCNPGNVLVGDTGDTLAGVIDFGDMIRAPLVIDLAIAASYMRPNESDVLGLVAPLVAGYDSVTRLTDVELELLYPLLRTRLATSIVLLYWRLQERSDGDAYSQASLASEGDAERFLKALGEIGSERFLQRMRLETGRSSA